jgi:wobble nucleotide-excising tRNase
MILKLRRIKDLGIFRDYRWDADLPDFCRYNLIYGWNGCGKTTLSRMFASLSEGKAERYPLLEYEIEGRCCRFS